MGTNLTYIPIDDINLIPRRLVEKLKDRDFEVDRFYEFGGLMLKNCIAAVFADRESIVRGFMVGTINPISLWLTVNFLAIDNEYYGKGIIKETRNILEKVVKQYGLKGLKITTTRPAGFEKNGFKRTKQTVMTWEI